MLGKIEQEYEDMVYQKKKKTTQTHTVNQYSSFIAHPYYRENIFVYGT